MMASPRSGSPNESKELLRIETDLFDLYIKGKPFHPTVNVLKLHRDGDSWIEASLDAASHSPLLNIESILVFSPEEGRLVDRYVHKVHPCFYETQTYELVIENKSSHQLHFHHENILLRNSIKPLGKSRILSGMLNFQNEVGYTDLEVRINNGPGLSLRLEIFPTKLDYKSDYDAILKDVNEQVYNLSFDFLRKTYHLTGLHETNQQSLTEYFAILQQVFGQLVQAVDRIKIHPHHRIYKEQRIVDAAKVKRAGKENIAFLLKRPHYLAKDSQSRILSVEGEWYRPTKLIETKGKLDYNTGENRFLRWMLEQINRKLKLISNQIVQNDRQKDPLLQGKITRMQMQIRRLLQLDFLVEVGMMQQMTISLVLQMTPGYREVYKIYLMLMKGLSIQSDLFHLSMKDLAQLYEYWCFLKIHHLLSNKYKMVKQGIIQHNRDGLFVTLNRSRETTVEYENPKNGERFMLYYNALPREDSHKDHPTLNQRPDNVLTLRKKDGQANQRVYKYVFDAKYRINPAYEGTSYHDKYNGMPGPEEEDINTMHRYRDAIVSLEDHTTTSLERSMFGAYVMFPYHDEEQYRQHHFYKSIGLVNIGAFPFLPNATSLMEKFLDELIEDSSEKAYERSIRPSGTTEYYRNKFEGKNVLIGPMSSGKQLGVALEHRFYHTPITQISDHALLTQLEYIALYQSVNFYGRTGDRAIGIHLYGRIVDWKVIPRNQITEIASSRGAIHDLYVKFTVESWLKREKPIEPAGKGIQRVVYTSKYMFDRVLEIAELKLETEEQLQEWREKRRQGKVKVDLDREYIDHAEVKGIRVE